MDLSWLTNLFTSTDSVAHIALLYALVIAVGVYLGKIKIAGLNAIMLCKTIIMNRQRQHSQFIINDSASLNILDYRMCLHNKNHLCSLEIRTKCLFFQFISTESVQRRETVFIKMTLPSIERKHRPTCWEQHRQRTLAVLHQ